MELVKMPSNKSEIRVTISRKTLGNANFSKLKFKNDLRSPIFLLKLERSSNSQTLEQFQNIHFVETVSQTYTNTIVRREGFVISKSRVTKFSSSSRSSRVIFSFPRARQWSEKVGRARRIARFLNNPRYVSILRELSRWISNARAPRWNFQMDRRSSKVGILGEFQICICTERKLLNDVRLSKVGVQR